MNDEAPTTKRRVYDLPTELVDRIVEFQKARSLPSEVEAARRLLDQALKNRDTLEMLIGRYLAALTPGTEPGEAAGSVLSGHPLVKSISFHDIGIEFTFQKPNTDSDRVTIVDENTISINYGQNGSYGITARYTYDASKAPGQRLRYKPEGQPKGDLNDDEIPF